MAQRPADQQFRNLGRRLKTAAFFLPPVVAAIYFGFPWFDLMVGLAAAVMLWEWTRMCRQGGFGLTGWAAEAALIGGLVILYAGGAAYAAAFVAAVAAAIAVVGLAKGENAVLHIAIGVALVGLFCLAFLWLRANPDHGRLMVAWLVFAVWFTDTGAYAAGKTIGGPKLAPRISPNKTWAGLAGGILAAFAWSALALGWYDGRALLPVAVAAVATAVLAQTGDLSVSVFKRRYGVKDTSALVPGHGGVLDRLDGMLLTGPAAALLFYLADRGLV